MQGHEIDEGKHYIPVDWALKSRMRFMSPKQFAWNQTLKASEEASGITGSDEMSYYSNFH